jgi:peptidyl-prolyl cis-trans isomerase SurA
MQMVYPFESAATKPVGQVSAPPSARASLPHVIKVNDKRTAQGEIKVVHPDSHERQRVPKATHSRLRRRLMSFTTAFKKGENWDKQFVAQFRGCPAANGGATIPSVLVA